MDNVSTFNEEHEGHTGVLAVAYDCTNKRCNGERTVMVEWDNGTLIGKCVLCKKKYLDPDYDEEA